MQFHQARMDARRAAMPMGMNTPAPMPGRPGFNRPAFSSIDTNGDGCINESGLKRFTRDAREQCRWNAGYGRAMPGMGSAATICPSSIVRP